MDQIIKYLIEIFYLDLSSGIKFLQMHPELLSNFSGDYSLSNLLSHIKNTDFHLTDKKIKILEFELQNLLSNLKDKQDQFNESAQIQNISQINAINRYKKIMYQNELNNLKQVSYNYKQKILQLDSKRDAEEFNTLTKEWGEVQIRVQLIQKLLANLQLKSVN